MLIGSLGDLVRGRKLSGKLREALSEFEFSEQEILFDRNIYGYAKYSNRRDEISHLEIRVTKETDSLLDKKTLMMLVKKFGSTTERIHYGIEGFSAFEDFQTIPTYGMNYLRLSRGEYREKFHVWHHMENKRVEREILNDLGVKLSLDNSNTNASVISYEKQIDAYLHFSRQLIHSKTSYICSTPSKALYVEEQKVENFVNRIICLRLSDDNADMFSNVIFNTFQKLGVEFPKTKWITEKYTVPIEIPIFLSYQKERKNLLPLNPTNCS